MLSRSRSTPNTSLPSNTLNVLKRKSVAMQDLPTIDVTRIIKDNYAHTRSVSQTRQIANSLIRHHYNQVLPKIVDFQRRAVESIPPGAVNLPSAPKQYVRYSFRHGIQGDAAPQVKFNDPRISMLARRAERNRALQSLRAQKLKPTTDEMMRVAGYCQAYDPTDKELLDCFQYKAYVEEHAGCLKFDPDDLLDEQVEKVAARQANIAATIRELLAKQIEAGTTEYVHLAHILKLEDLFRQLVEMTDNGGELRANMELLDDVRAKISLYLVGETAPKSFVTFQGFQELVIKQLASNAEQLNSFLQTWMRRGKNFSAIVEPLIKAETAHRESVISAIDVIEIALNYQEHCDRRTEAMAPAYEQLK